MEVDVLELEKLISLAELAVNGEECTLRELTYSLEHKDMEAQILKEGIEGLEGRKLDKEEKQNLENEIGKLELVKEKIENLKKQIGYWEEKLKNDKQLLKRWEKKVESAES